jgi:hypothetical protein
MILLFQLLELLYRLQAHIHKPLSFHLCTFSREAELERRSLKLADREAALAGKEVRHVLALRMSLPPVPLFMSTFTYPSLFLYMCLFASYLPFALV